MTVQQLPLFPDQDTVTVAVAVFKEGDLWKAVIYSGRGWVALAETRPKAVKIVVSRFVKECQYLGYELKEIK